MKRILALTLGLALMAVPAEAQLFNFPVYSLPSASDAGATFIAATYGRGLNDGSGKQDAYGAFVGRSGIGGRATIGVGGGMIDSSPDSEWTFGGAVGVDLLQTGSAAVSIQSGVGYISFDLGTSDLTTLHIPIGVAIKGMIEGPTATVVPWIMPRISIFRSSFASVSDTSTEFGASGGVSFTLPGGFGAHTALDLMATDPSSWLVGVGIHYLIG
jgi:hypothetical protein